MSIEFASAQARAQAHLGQRLLSADWQVLESSRGLAQFLHVARGTALAQFVLDITATSTTHFIERSLRRMWRMQVEAASRWAPPPWRASIRWLASLADLPAIAYLKNGGEAHRWMTEDPQLAGLASAETNVRQSATDAAGIGKMNSSAQTEDPLQSWLDQWHALWPAPASASAGLQQLTEMLLTHRSALHRDTAESTAAPERREILQLRIARLMRMQMQMPHTVFCHLALRALEMQRLRSGLVRRTLFKTIDPTSVS